MDERRLVWIGPIRIIRSRRSSEGQYPQADYAFDQGVLPRPLTEVIEAKGKQKHHGEIFVK